MESCLKKLKFCYFLKREYTLTFLPSKWNTNLKIHRMYPLYSIEVWEALLSSQFVFFLSQLKIPSLTRPSHFPRFISLYYIALWLAVLSSPPCLRLLNLPNCWTFPTNFGLCTCLEGLLPFFMWSTLTLCLRQLHHDFLQPPGWAECLSHSEPLSEQCLSN